jgi:hypothetical protein
VVERKIPITTLCYNRIRYDVVLDLELSVGRLKHGLRMTTRGRLSKNRESSAVE